MGRVIVLRAKFSAVMVLFLLFFGLMCGLKAYDIPLDAGWNLISLPVQPLECDISGQTASIAGKFTKLLAREGGSWKIYDPANASLSDKLALEPGKGYWISMSSAGTLSLTDSGLAPSKLVKLGAGWNLVGCTLSEAAAVSQALQSISGKYEKVAEYSGGTWKYYPGTLSQLTPGRGYWIKAVEPCLLNFGAGQTNAASSSDGGTVEFPDLGSLSGLGASFSKISDADGQLSDIVRDLSGRYRLQLDTSSLESLDEDLIFSIPLDESFFDPSIPPESIASYLLPMFYDESAGEWKAFGDMVTYDPASKTALVQANLSKLAAATAASDNVKGGRGDTPGTVNTIIKIGGFTIQSITTNHEYTATKDGSVFTIHYYIGSDKYEIPTNPEWEDLGSGIYDQTSGVPYYVQDLFKALDAAYENLMLDEGLNGKVFSKLTNKKVCISNYGDGVDGCTNFAGGDIKISNTLENWASMKSTACHELVHCLQSQKYGAWGIGTGQYNKWFIEAVANYYCARYCSLTDEDRKNYIYAGNTRSYVDGKWSNDAPLFEYMLWPVNSNKMRSYYSASHFLVWLSETYSPKLIGTALERKWFDDTTNLGEAIRQWNEEHSLLSAYWAYCGDIVKKPDYCAQTNNYIKDRMYDQASNSELRKIAQFVFPAKPDLAWNRFADGKDPITYAKLTKSMENYSSAYVYFRAGNASNALLVFDSSATTNPGFYKTYTYDFIGKTDASYSGKSPLEDAGALFFGGQKPYTIKNFGKSGDVKEVEQWISVGNSSSSLNMAYYILLPPVVTKTEAGKVTWSTKEVGQIPASLIDGYQIYRNGVKLNSYSVPYAAGEQSFSDSRILANDPDVTVHIKDVYGNVWPVPDILLNLQKTKIVLLELWNGVTPMTVNAEQYGSSETLTFTGYFVDYCNFDVWGEHPQYGDVTWSGNQFSYSFKGDSATDGDTPIIRTTTYSGGYYHRYDMNISGTVDDSGNIVSATFNLNADRYYPDFSATPNIYHVEFNLSNIYLDSISEDNYSVTHYYYITKAEAPYKVTGLKAQWGDPYPFGNAAYTLISSDWANATNNIVGIIWLKQRK